LQLAAFAEAGIEARKKGTDHLALEFPLSHKLLLGGTRHKGQRRDGDDQETEKAMHGNKMIWLDCVKNETTPVCKQSATLTRRKRLGGCQKRDLQEPFRPELIVGHNNGPS
jgi:hypothetical protein